MAHLRIAVIMPYRLAYGRGILRGITGFAQQAGTWVLSLIDPQYASARALRRIGPDGIIAHIFSPRTARVIRQSNCPAVNVVAGGPDVSFSCVGVDDLAVGRAAAAHLLSTGLRHFAYLGYPQQPFSMARGQGFADSLRAAAQTLHHCHIRCPDDFDPCAILTRPDLRLRRWLLSLPKPVGVFTSDDISGLRLTELCRDLGLRIPDEVAIVGVDNDDLLCEMSRPPLSSVALPTQRIGYEAARRLASLLAGRAPASWLRLLQPAGVVARASSELIAVDDAELAAALRFIRDRAHHSIGVEDIVHEIAISRSGLERRFKHVMGRSPLQEIHRVRLERAKRLLASGDQPIAAVARQSGFHEPKQLSTTFRNATGMTPTAYRRRFKMSSK